MSTRLLTLRLKIVNISWTCARDDLRKYFENYGKVNWVSIPMDRMTGFNKKLAFVGMEAHDDVSNKILRATHIIDDQEVKVEVQTDDANTNANKTELKDQENILT